MRYSPSGCSHGLSLSRRPGNSQWKTMQQLDLVAFAAKFSNYYRATSRTKEPMNMFSLRSHARGSRRESTGTVNQRSTAVRIRRTIDVKEKSKLFAELTGIGGEKASTRCGRAEQTKLSECLEARRRWAANVHSAPHCTQLNFHPFGFVSN